MERYYTRTAERAARELERRMREQERRDAAAAGDGLDPGYKRFMREQRDQGRRTRKQPRTPRKYG